MKFLGWFLTQAIALAVALWALPGLKIVMDGPQLDGIEELQAKLWRILLLALIVGVVNAVIGPIVKIVTFPLILLTLGLFSLVINAGLLLLIEKVTSHTGLGFVIDGFWPAVWGGIIMAVVAVIVRRLIPLK